MHTVSFLFAPALSLLFTCDNNYDNLTSGNKCVYTVEPLNNGHGGDEHFFHCSEVVPLSEVEMYGQLMAGGKQFVPCREVVLLLECPCIIGGFTVIIFWAIRCTCAFEIEL